MDINVLDKYEESIKVEGNEKLILQPPLTVSRQILCKFWCCGIFNIERHILIKTFEKHKHFHKGIIGREICPTTNKVHMQVFVAFNKPIRPKEAFNKIDTKWIKCDGSEGQNERYCSKDGDFEKFGELFESDWKIMRWDLRKNQIEIVDEILAPVNPKFNREVLWYWEPKGGFGKTITYTYLVDNHKCLICGGKESDMKFAVSEYIKVNGFPKIIVINLEMAKDKISYTGLEACLDGLFFSSKYESGMCRFPRCRVVVFANIPPDESAMGQNRFKVRLLGSSPDGQEDTRSALSSQIDSV